MAWKRRRTARTVAATASGVVGSWVRALGGHLARLIRGLRRVALQAGADLQFLVVAATKWIHPRAIASWRHARLWGIDRVAQARESVEDLAEQDWHLSRSIPGLGSSVVPLVILVVAVALALGLGGAIAAALS